MNHTHAPFATGPVDIPLPPGPVDELLSGLPGLADRTSRLIQRAALALGLDERGADLAGRSSTLSAGENTVVVMPVSQSDDGTLSLMVSVHTRLPVSVGGDNGRAAVALLQHAPGALHTFSAALGATPDGCWALHRGLRVSTDDPSALAAHLVETLHLAEFVLFGGTQAGH